MAMHNGVILGIRVQFADSKELKLMLPPLWQPVAVDVSLPSFPLVENEAAELLNAIATTGSCHDAT